MAVRSKKQVSKFHFRVMSFLIVLTSFLASFLDALQSRQRFSFVPSGVEMDFGAKTLILRRTPKKTRMARMCGLKR